MSVASHCCCLYKQMSVKSEVVAQLAPLVAAMRHPTFEEQQRGSLFPQLCAALVALEASCGLSWRLQESIMRTCSG